jgi:hypothetical protein
MKKTLLVFAFLFTTLLMSAQQITWGSLMKIKSAGCLEYLGINKGEHFALKSATSLRYNSLARRFEHRGGSGIRFEVKGDVKVGIVNLGKDFTKSEVTELTLSYPLQLLYEAFVQDDHLYLVYSGSMSKQESKIIIETFSIRGVSEKKQEIAFNNKWTITYLTFSPNKSQMLIASCGYPAGDDYADIPVIKNLVSYTLDKGNAQLKEEMNVEALNCVSEVMVNNAGDAFYVGKTAGTYYLYKGLKSAIKTVLMSKSIYGLNFEFFEKENKLAISALSGWAKNNKTYAEESLVYLFNNSTNALDFSTTYKIDAKYFTEKGKNGVKNLVNKKLFLVNGKEVVNVLQREELYEVANSTQSGGGTSTSIRYEFYEADAIVLKTDGTNTNSLLIAIEEKSSDAANPKLGISNGYINANKLLLLYNVRKGNDFKLIVGSIDLSNFTFKEEQVIETTKLHDVEFENQKFFSTDQGDFFIAAGGGLLNRRFKVGVIK